MDRKVLIADDDLLVCKGLRELIPWKELGVSQLFEAHNGKRAYELAILNDPDLILSDIKMPVMDGLQLCNQLNKIMVDTSIILLSAYEDFEYARTAIQYGVSYYLVKPINRQKIEELTEIIRKTLKEKTERRKCYSDVFSGELQAEVRKVLGEFDSKYFTDFFDCKMRSGGLSNENCFVICVGLIDILYGFLEDVGFPAGMLVVSKENALNNITDMNTTDEILNYVQQMYLDVIQFAVVKKADSRDDYIVDHVKAHILEHYGDADLSVTSLSGIFHISPSYLSCIFKKELRINLSPYIAEVRIQKASELLAQPHAKVAAVSEAVGFRDPLYFAKVFKKHKGMTPSDYHNLTQSSGGGFEK